MKVTTNQERLNELFESDSRSLTSIASSLGVSKQAISMWRSGSRSPKKSVLIKIAEMYNVSIEWLMGFDVPKNIDEYKKGFIPDLDLFKKIFLAMTPDDSATVMEILGRTERAMRERGEL